MKAESSKPFLIWFFALMAGPALAIEEGEVTHWPDGRPMKCSYFFPDDSYVIWEQENGPPVTIADVNDIFRAWVDSRYPGDEAFIRNYHLVGVRPWQRDGLWAYFIEYGVFENGVPVMRMSDTKELAISLTGSVVEPQCDAP